MSVIAAMAPNGRLYVSGQNKSYNGEAIVGFLEYLSRKYRRKNLIIIWQGRLADGATIHRCHEVKDFLARKKGRVHLVALPGYSPELNPVELLWSQLKRDLKNTVFLSLEDLTKVLVEKIEEIRKDTQLLVSFFYKKEIDFFTG